MKGAWDLLGYFCVLSGESVINTNQAETFPEDSSPVSLRRNLTISAFNSILDDSVTQLWLRISGVMNRICVLSSSAWCEGKEL